MASAMQIMRRTGQSTPTLWRWQARFAAEGVWTATAADILDKGRRGKQVLESGH